MPSFMTMTRKPDKDRQPPPEPAPSSQTPPPRKALLGFRDRTRDAGDRGAGGQDNKGFH